MRPTYGFWGSRWLLFFHLISAVGCSTGYHVVRINGGYEDFPLQDNFYQVAFHGNGFTPEEKSEDYALLRASEVTLDNGYQFFAVTEKVVNSHEKVVANPQVASTVRTPSANLVIQCFHEKPGEIGQMIYDATQVKNNLRSKYKMVASEQRGRK